MHNSTDDTSQNSPLKFYLAGKIHKNDWRGLRGWGWGNIDPIGSNPDAWDNATWEPTELSGGIVTGPFFISDDHGCAHGPNTHGVAAGEDGFCGDAYDSPRRATVHRLCVTAIEEAEVVLAWLGDDDATTAYGTLYELGYAKGLGKTIIIGTDRHQDDLWLAFEGADHVVRLDDSGQMHDVIEVLAAAKREGLDPVKTLRIAYRERAPKKVVSRRLDFG